MTIQSIIPFEGKSMLPLQQQLAFAIFAIITIAVGIHGFYKVYRYISAGRQDMDERFDHIPKRLWYSLVTTLTQSRTFRKRPAISFFHAFIFYGFVIYLLVNLLDAAAGYIRFNISSNTVIGGLYNFLADLLSALVLVGVVALVFRRFLLPSRRNFSFNERTILHEDIRNKRIALDSIVVSAFILFHVGSRALGAGAKLAQEGPDPFQPFATLLSHAFTKENAEGWRIFGYWGALGSVLLFLMYFPRSKHIHIFMAPMKYLLARKVSSGVLPAVDMDIDQSSEAEEPKLGANKLEDLAWPRLLDAYACIQCNRCQDVCPATATGKALSPSALEINKRMELNDLARERSGFENGTLSPTPLLTFALSPEAAWACTTCGACMEVCPVQDEPMLDIIDIRRHQVMIKGEFPTPLQTAFRGMERAKNPWGIGHDKRLDWAEGLKIKTTDENPEPDVLFFVGCAASYDPQSQKTARAFVELLHHAGVNFAVLGKNECCTGESARRAGNEYLYLQLAEQNISTLNTLRPKQIVTTCPHCMNTIGREYRQLGGNFNVLHHTQYLESLVADGKLTPEVTSATITYHDPCYLGRHNGVYDAPRNLLKVLSNSVVELGRNRENSFCCGAGGAQFWKEEEPGAQRISENRYNEVKKALEGGEEKILAVGCPFCKSMLGSTPGKETDSIEIKDIAELLLASVQKSSDGEITAAVTKSPEEAPITVSLPATAEPSVREQVEPRAPIVETPAEQTQPDSVKMAEVNNQEGNKRKKWAPKVSLQSATPAIPQSDLTETPRKESSTESSTPPPTGEVSAEKQKRKTWVPKQNSGK